MKAPIHAYVTDDEGNFTKLTIQRDSTPYSHFVARYLKDSAAEGGYSSEPQQMKNAVMTLFHLDHLTDVFLKVSPTEVRLVGFVGLVLQGGSNEPYHNMAVRGSGLREFKEGGGTYLYLNDAGLNTRPYTAIVVTSRYANYVTAELSARAGFYVPVSGGTVKRIAYGETVQTDVPPTAAGQTYKGYVNATYATPVNAVTGLIEQYDGPVDEGASVGLEIAAQSEEGQTVSQTSFTALARIVVPRPTFNYSESEPDWLGDMQETAKDIDMFESDAISMSYVQEGGQAAPVETPPMYLGGGAPDLSIANLAPTGWYHSSLFDAGNDSEGKAFYVLDGYVQYYKRIPLISGTWGVRLTVTMQEYGSSGGWPASPGGSWKYRIRVTMQYYAEEGNPLTPPPAVSLSTFTFRTARTQGGSSEPLLEYSAQSLADTLSIDADNRSDTSDYIYANDSLYDGSYALWMSVNTYTVVDNSHNLGIFAETTMVRQANN